MSNEQQIIPSMPNALRISLPEYGPWNNPHKNFSDMVEVLQVSKEAILRIGPCQCSSNPGSLSIEDAPVEIPLSSMQCIERKIHYGVCRAVYNHQNVVIKFVFGCEIPRWFALEREARHYNSCLLPVQGTRVPVLHGFYKGISCDGSRTPVSCLVLEDCGDRLTQPFRKLPLEERLKILKEYCELHKYGVSLNAFAERNVVRKNGTYRFIDFEDINDKHECTWKGSFYEGMTKPHFGKIGCSYVMSACGEMKLWKQSNDVVRIDHRFMKADGFPSQEDIDFLCNDADFCVSPQKIEELHEWLRGYKQVKDKMAPEQYATTRPDFEY
ncbi:hypothetical protein SCHPADRAFT_997480 [Schizopora paradoxa]|uniref:Protein kinase domain-containing protein n=1 Tax=Schizopora paradoxa TaxID=27342 RepID=A0A0H2RMZ4_9AGAM|nr:hypothetical protein SCHPADRAFT_997480 [Schizopora paradoxa]